MPADNGIRFNDRQRIANSWEQPIEANEYQSVNGIEGDFLWRLSSQDVDLLPQRPNLRFEHCARPEQIDDHPNKKLANISHPATGLPDSRSTASRIQFSTGTGYSLEMANPRHEHEWRVWEHVKLPTGKVLLLGLVSHSTNVVEHPELVAERIVRLANLIGADRVIASTDCGFAQGPFARRVHPSIMWAKLRALSEGARLAER
jgi:hypothetical protein